MQKKCPEHGEQEVLLASDKDWYESVIRWAHKAGNTFAAAMPSRQGCPHDCGLCSQHGQGLFLPVIPVTSACQMKCAICYTHNKNDQPYYMPMEEFRRILKVIRCADPENRIINFTGGEPTDHPNFLQMIKLCAAEGIHRITVSTHGLGFLENKKLLEELALYRARVVLSFHSFTKEVWLKMCGSDLLEKKLKILDLLGQYQLDTTLIPVINKGINDDELGLFLDCLKKSFVRSLEIHTMAFTGQGGLAFAGTRTTVPDVIKKLEQLSQGLIKQSDFVPSPLAHPLCYQTCYLMRLDDDHYIPFTRIMSDENIRTLLSAGLYMEPGQVMERVMQDVMMDLWSKNLPGDLSTRVLKAVKKLLLDMFPARPISYAAQQQIAEGAAKTIYIHSHMDDETFDVQRVRLCPVMVPDGEGHLIPTCSYNVLYRHQDPKFI
ncbi:MAG: radical SAM protein [Deltaproteobacteria bacterium]|nr:radical SAM protein [Deltaproteobacteria bacterium]